MKNDYHVEGETVYIHLNNHEQFAMVSLSDFDVANSIPGRWHLKSLKKPYVMTKITAKGETQRVCLHRLLTNTPSGLIVDHINGNPLDNRKTNLRVVTNKINAQNRYVSKNSKTGVNGVYISKTGRYVGKYVAQIKIDGTVKKLGYFETLEEAKNKAVEARYKLFSGYVGRAHF